ncbi:Imm52 family immunity protein [Streptomyces sp. NPDC048484]|uniref:Imm52 family immunity protein n=1 Tax=Streptomyces sp. NPDC048484 TaxID=3155146 RepID=UPI003423D701
MLCVDATEAEKDASSARKAASDATAEADAADFSADLAEIDAAVAQTAADNGQQAAKDAQAAATRAEEEECKRLVEERRKAFESGDAGVTGIGGPLSADDRAVLLAACGQSCVDDWDEATAAATASVIDWVRANGAEVLLEVIGVNDLKRCLGQGDVESCLLTAVNVAALVVVVGKFPVVSKAITTVATKIGQFFDRAEWGKRTLDHLRKVIEAAKKEPDRGSTSSIPCTHPGAAGCKNITFPFKGKGPGKDKLGSDNKYHLKEGDLDENVFDYVNDKTFSNRITNIDLIKGGVLWENKTVTGRVLSQAEMERWVSKHVGKKVASYQKAQEFVKGYEDAPIGIRFEDPKNQHRQPGHEGSRGEASGEAPRGVPRCQHQVVVAVTTDDFYLGAYWGDRAESAAGCARRLASFLDRLAALHPGLEEWYGPFEGDDEEIPEVRRIPSGVDALEAYIEENRPWSPDAADETLGFDVSLWTENHAVPLGVHCGIHADTPTLLNCVVLDFPEPSESWAGSYDPKTVRAVLMSVVEVWEPDWATFINASMREAQGGSSGEALSSVC